MARVLIRLKLALLRHAVRGGDGTFLLLGAATGAVIAARMLLAGLDGRSDPTGAFTTFALLAAAWAVGWLLVASTGGGDPLRPEFFGLIPVPTGRLASSLLLASFVGVLPAAVLLSLSGLILAASALGPVALVLAVAAVPVITMLVSLVALVVTAATGAASQSRVGLEIAGFSRGALIALIWIWVPIAAIAGGTGSVADIGASAVLAMLARLLPTGWAVVVVEAAGRGDWPVACAAGAGLLLLIVALAHVWRRLLARRLAGDEIGRPTGRVPTGRVPTGRVPAAPDPAAPAAASPAGGRPASGRLGWIVPRTPFGAAVGREILAWRRHPRRGVEVRSALWTAAILTVLPAAFGSTVLLPFTGLTFVLAAAITTANLYGFDGTALWLTVEAPSTVRADVRARQLVWLMVVGPAGLAATVTLAVASGATWILAWTLPALIALVFVSAGLVPLVSLLSPAPLPERRGRNPLDLGDDPRTTGALLTQGIVMTFLPPILAAPAIALGAADPALAWADIPIGLAVGVASIWAFGRVAAWRLMRRGPELLERMRARPAPAGRSRRPVGADVPPTAWGLVFVGSILLFPQSLVPLLIRLAESPTRLWFAPLYLPDALQLPAIIGMGAAGIAAYAAAWRLRGRGRVKR